MSQVEKSVEILCQSDTIYSKLSSQITLQLRCIEDGVKHLLYALFSAAMLDIKGMKEDAYRSASHFALATVTPMGFISPPILKLMASALGFQIEPRPRHSLQRVNDLLQRVALLHGSQLVLIAALTAAATILVKSSVGGKSVAKLASSSPRIDYSGGVVAVCLASAGLVGGLVGRLQRSKQTISSTPVWEERGYRRQDVRGDGSCAIHAVLVAMDPKTDLAQRTPETRKKVVDAIKTCADRQINDPLFWEEGELNEEAYVSFIGDHRGDKKQALDIVETYCKKMAKPKSWFGNLEMLFLAQVLDVKINIYKDNNLEEEVMKPHSLGEEGKREICVYHGNGHYQALFKIDQQLQPCE